MQLSQKECGFLKELKEQEKLCIGKYEKAAGAAVDGQLKGLFTELASQERQHLTTLSQMEQGQLSEPPQTPPAPSPSFTQVYAQADSPDKQNDCFLCTDLLSGEKHVSGMYDTAVFEFRDDVARRMLGHIQHEEQGHGKAIYNYMAANCMYG